MTDTDLQRLRREFPILSTRINGHPLAYLDNAATTQKPRRVIDAISRYYKQENANVHRAAHTLSGRATTAFEGARSALASWVNASSSREVIWTRGTTEAINLVAYSYLRPRLRAGDRVLLMESSHHANIVPWQLAAQDCGAIIDVLPAANGDIDQQQYQDLLSRNPRFVALTHVSNALGTIYPVAEMAAQARQAGAGVLIDGAQAMPHFDIDVQSLNCDFYALSAHKLFGPTGVGALWAREALLLEMPPWQSGGEMIERVSFDGTRFAGLPFKFEAGTPDIAGVIGFGAAIDYLRTLDRPALEFHEQQLLNYALECCTSLPGFQRIAAGQNCVSLFSFLIRGHHPQDIALWLDQRGIAVRAGHHCAMPLMDALGLPGTVRASFAWYNTRSEVEQMAQALEQLLQSQLTQVANAEPTGGSTPLIEQIHAAKDWNSRYRLLMQLGKELPNLPAQDKSDENRLHGCESRVWLVLETHPDGKLACRADADARILRALLGLLLHEVNGKDVRSLLDIDLRAKIERLDLERHLSPSRGNGLLAMIDALQAHIKKSAAKLSKSAFEDSDADTDEER